MRKHLLAAGIAVAALIPTFAAAQESCQQRASDRAAGTVVGAGIGAILGSAVAGGHDRGAGAVVGGVSGAVVGNQLARGDGNCVHAYGYYDNNGAWHYNEVARADARGYYDRNGAWIDGAPAGHWDDRGHWAVMGANTYGSNAAYVVNPRWDNAPGDVHSRIAWLDDRVRRNMDSGAISRHDGHAALRNIDAIRDEENNIRRRHNGELNDRDAAYLQSKLDAVRDQIHFARESHNY